MAEKSTASRQVSARERARTKAAEYRQRENRLEALAVEYFTAADLMEKVYAQRDREVEAAEAKAERTAADAVAASDQVVRTMLDAGVQRGEVIDRLGCTPADMRRATAAQPDRPPAQPISIGDAAADAPQTDPDARVAGGARGAGGDALGDAYATEQEEAHAFAS
ncbi:hypothetical protein ACIRCZ_18580 [Leifsonia sp. NPDC102414]|uniref:hypothetical protein n=1 Tax=Leifsonia sp. NPDC102414 TaxID=3364124 RepID=UPI003830E9B6